LKDDGYSYWSGIIEGYTFGNNTGPNATNLYQSDVLVDSGTAYMILNPNIFAEYNALWTPPATFVTFTGTQAPGYYYVGCNAAAPDFNIVIVSQNVVIPSGDLIYRTEDGVADPSFSQARIHLGIGHAHFQEQRCSFWWRCTGRSFCAEALNF
jgi:hypothetical protein